MGSIPQLNRVPLATYRLQFNRHFTFNQAAEIISYLVDLGISDVYASPLFLAGPESTHGYDVCNFNQLNPALGTSTNFDPFTARLRESHLGLLLDIVPNHMGASFTNDWWRDVLRHGVESKYARWFDIVWEARADRKVLLPILGERYGEVLKQGQFRLDFDGNDLYLTYFDKKFPLSPSSQDQLKRTAGFKTGDPNSIHALKRLLDEVNDAPEKLHKIIQAQHYRLAYWRVGPYEINYRRFFDVTDLISLRVEDEHAFDAAHQFTFDLIKQGKVTGLRVDHPDGLWDPKTYFDRLQSRSRDFFIVAEKILSNDEKLPDDWPIAGTTGYDFLNHLNGIFIAAENEPHFTDIYSHFTGTTADYKHVEYESKKYVLQNLFPREVYALTNRFRRIVDQFPEGVDFITPELEAAIVEVIAAFPVYRTYARADLSQLPSSEENHVREAVQTAGKRVLEMAPALELLQRILLLQIQDPASLKQECSEFVSRFQQLTGPAVAKGLEDTAFYRYTRFVSLNEVGGNPGRFGTAVEAFHEHNRHKLQHWPHSPLATATHDTKRGEDLRARLNVLSEIPDEWRKHLALWQNYNGPLKHNGSPSANDEYLFYQILIGSWTGSTDLNAYIARIHQYMEKAAREAKLHTSWIDPCPAYEEATKHFVEAVLRSDKFRATFEPFAQRISYFGLFNSLSQVLLKTCSPGLPDFYQGTEFWDFNLVDPDNRRPVDYNLREQILARVKSADPRELLRNAESGEVKMFTTWAALHFRNSHRELFEKGNYVPQHVRGSKRNHVIALTREFDGKRTIAIAPRLCLTLVNGETKPPLGPEVWGDTELELPGGNYRNYFTGKAVNTGKLAELLSDFPVALFESI